MLLLTEHICLTLGDSKFLLLSSQSNSSLALSSSVACLFHGTLFQSTYFVSFVNPVVLIHHPVLNFVVISNKRKGTPLCALSSELFSQQKCAMLTNLQKKYILFWHVKHESMRCSRDGGVLYWSLRSVLVKPRLCDAWWGVQRRHGSVVGVDFLCGGAVGLQLDIL